MRITGPSSVLFFFSGCSISNPDTEEASLAAIPTTESQASGRQIEEHDFGRVLAQGQTLHHEFTLRNPTGHSLRLIGAATSMPCCSAIGPLPPSVPPGGSVPVPVTLKTENKLGALRVSCSVKTDSPTVPVLRFAATVNLIPECEIEAEGESVGQLLLGQEGRFSCRISCRRKGVEGRELPTSVKVSRTTEAVLTGPIGETRQPDGIIERACQLDLKVPPSSQAGWRREEVLLEWPDGRKQSHLVSWEVRPLITAVPSGLVIARSTKPTDVTIKVASVDRPIRIREVDGLLAKPFVPMEEARREHILHLVFDTPKADPTTISDIKIVTDHPDQPVVSATVLLTASTEGGNL